MNNHLNWKGRQHTQTTLAVFAVIAVVAIVGALAATIHHVDTGQAARDLPPGTIGLAHPHPPLDRGPGEAVK
jgi:hypothetical protein